MTDFIFLHGGEQGGWIWDETVAAIEAQSGGSVRCLQLDVPGCGAKQTRETGGLTFRYIVEELADDMGRSGMTEALLVGHSQAGTLVPALIGLRRAMLSRVVYVSCMAPEPGRTVHEAAGAIFADDPDSPAARAFADPEVPMTEKYRAMFCNDMTKAEADAFLARLGNDAWPPVAYAERGWSYEHAGSVPSTFVECLQDAILPPKWQRRYAELFRAESFVRIDCGHQAMNTRPQALAEVLLAEAS